MWWKNRRNKHKNLNIHRLNNVPNEIDEKVNFNNVSYITRIKTIKEYLNHCDDVKYIEFSLDSSSKNHCSIIYINSLADAEKINKRIINPILNISLENEECEFNNIIQILFKEEILLAQYKKVNTFNEVINSLLSGETIILCQNSQDCYAVPTEEKINYPIAESKTETSLVGPKTSFTNDINVNIRLIRSYIESHKLKIRKIKVGKYTNSDVCIVYLEDLAPIDLVNDITNKIKQIDIDGVLDVNYIEEIIENTKLSLFPQVLKTERVDRAIGNILEGRITLLVDGSNSVGILPITINAFFQTPEDYYIRPFFATFLRLFRYGAFITASTVTPLYVAVSAYHYEVIPFKLLIPFAESIAPIPFPPIFEALLLEIFAQVLSESSSRMAGTMGPMIGILGAVLVGQAAVEANFASPVLVITVAIGVVSSFSIPNYEFVMVARIIKFILIIAAGMLWGFGIGIVWMIIIIHLCSLESFGVPYFSGTAPFKVVDIQDMVFRSSHRFMKRRPAEIENKDRLSDVPRSEK